MSSYGIARIMRAGLLPTLQFAKLCLCQKLIKVEGCGRSFGGEDTRLAFWGGHRATAHTPKICLASHRMLCPRNLLESSGKAFYFPSRLWPIFWCWGHYRDVSLPLDLIAKTVCLSKIIKSLMFAVVQ